MLKWEHSYVGKAPLPHNKRNCYPPYPDQLINENNNSCFETPVHNKITDSFNLGQKVLRILHFLTHRTPTLRIWHHGDPFPHPSLAGAHFPWSMLFSREKNIPATLQHCALAGEGKESWVNRALKGSILKLGKQRAFFLTFLSKIVAQKNSC